MSRLLVNNKPAKFLIVLLLAFIVSCPVIFPFEASAQSSDYYNKSFAWDYAGRHWNWNLTIPAALYNAYKTVPVSTRTRDGPAGYGYCTTTKDPYIQTLARELNSTAAKQGYNSYDEVSFILAFVQSLPYSSDNVTEGYNEYPRFPIETLVDGGGDCEDTSILFASLTLILGYGTVYINPPDHYAVGVLGNNLQGTYWVYPQDSNSTYYCCETTGNGFTIGELPQEFQGQKAFIYTIDESKQFVPNIKITPLEPTPTGVAFTTEPTPTNPTDSALPTMGAPTMQPPMTISFDLVMRNPGLFAIILAAIIISIFAAVFSTRRPEKSRGSPTVFQEQNHATATSASFEGETDQKFCIFCGTNNKTYAMYCEQCGKKIG
jgi:hypothetical protein